MIAFKTYHTKRRLIQIFSTLLIIGIPFLNVFRLDIPTLRFYFLHTILWIDEFHLLFLVAMLGLWIIVIFAMLYGRVWCGWMCPQTVLDEIIYWIEGKIKILLKYSRTENNIIKRISLFIISSIPALALSLWVSFNLVAYFVDPYRMISEIMSGTLDTITGGIIIGIAVLVYVDVMFWREKFCTKTCPYGMMQFVITDEKTQIVRYQTERSEDCIECKACIRDCMMGIDIRESPYQTECIQCGECVDSCKKILGRLNTPKPTLIIFSWGEKGGGKRWFERLGLLDAKRWMVLGITFIFTVVLFIMVHMRQPLSVSVTGDRSTLYHQINDSTIYNEYKMRISNRSLTDGEFIFNFDGANVVKWNCILHIPENPIRLKSREVRDLKFSISTTGDYLNPGPNRLVLKTSKKDNPEIYTTTEVIFFMPQEVIYLIGMMN